MCTAISRSLLDCLPLCSVEGLSEDSDSSSSFDPMMMEAPPLVPMARGAKDSKASITTTSKENALASAETEVARTTAVVGDPVGVRTNTLERLRSRQSSVSTSPLVVAGAGGGIVVQGPRESFAAKKPKRKTGRVSSGNWHHKVRIRVDIIATSCFTPSSSRYLRAHEQGAITGRKKYSNLPVKARKKRKKPPKRQNRPPQITVLGTESTHTIVQRPHKDSPRKVTFGGSQYSTVAVRARVCVRSGLVSEWSSRHHAQEPTCGHTHVFIRPV